MKIYTKTGDDGTTGLFGGVRVHKDALRIEVYGTVDELNTVIGIARAHFINETLDTFLSRIQHQLFVAGSDLATPLPAKNVSVSRITNDDTGSLEIIIDEIEAVLEPLKSFILPGGNRAAAYLHFARTVARRAERRCVTLASLDEINPAVVPFLNRLSDCLFVLARYANHVTGTEEVKWKTKE